MNFIYKLKKITALFLILTLIILQSGCSFNESEKNNSTTTKNNVSESPLSSFDDFTNELFKEILCSNTLNLHSLLKDPASYGITDYEVTLGTYSEDSLDNTSFLIQCLNALNGFDKNKLSSSQQITYEQLKQYFENELEYSDLFLYGSSLSPTTGIQVALPIVFAEYSFSCEKDVQDYIALLNQTDTYFNGLISFEQLRSKNELFMEDTIADKIIDQCQIFIDGADDGYLISTFNERIEQLTNLNETQRNNYKTANEEAVSKHLIPAYKELISGLKSLKGTNKHTGGLSNYPNGKQYYQYLLKSELGWSKSVEELDALLDNYIKEAFLKMGAILNENPTLLEYAESFSFELTDVNQIINDLKEKIKRDFPSAPNINCDIKYVNKSLEDYASPAMYLLPQIDNITENVIYINNKINNKSSLYATLAHEGYPGHMYQSTYFASSNPAPIRTLLRPSGYLEGWASYCELYSYSLASSKKPELNTLMSMNYLTILLMYSKVDIGVNYYGWTKENTAAFLSGYGIEDRETVNEMYYAMIAEPANYPNYSLGCVAFLEFRKTAETALAETFDIKTFHKFLMDMGPVPFDMLDKQLKEWLKQQ